jgi:hypothetical protein
LQPFLSPEHSFSSSLPWKTRFWRFLAVAASPALSLTSMWGLHSSSIFSLETSDSGHELFWIRLTWYVYFIFILCCYITIPRGKLASGAPPKGSPGDGPETPNGASNQHLTGRMQRKRETSETRLTLAQIKPSKGGGRRRGN